MAEIDARTERELYEDWKPLLEGQQDDLITEDVEQNEQELMIEQVNGSRGLDVEGNIGVYRKPPRDFDDLC